MRRRCIHQRDEQADVMTVRRSRGNLRQESFYSPLYNTYDDEIEHCDLMIISKSRRFAVFQVQNYQTDIASP